MRPVVARVLRAEREVVEVTGRTNKPNAFQCVACGSWQTPGIVSAPTSTPASEAGSRRGKPGLEQEIPAPSAAILTATTLSCPIQFAVAVDYASSVEKKRRSSKPHSSAARNRIAGRRPAHAGFARQRQDNEHIDLMLKAMGKDVAMNFRRIGELQAQIDLLKSEIARIARWIKI